MPKKLGVKFICANCGAVSGSWTGRCQVCGEWNTLKEQIEIAAAAADRAGKQLAGETIDHAATAKTKRLSSKINDVDNVLGGGFVAGSVNLLAGQPGIGKSTLLLQIAANIAAGNKVLYVSGEESARQVAMRAERLGIKSGMLQLAVSSVTNDIAATIAAGGFDLVVVDSVQSVVVNEISA